MFIIDHNLHFSAPRFFFTSQSFRILKLYAKGYISRITYMHIDLSACPLSGMLVDSAPDLVAEGKCVDVQYLLVVVWLPEEMAGGLTTGDIYIP